MRVIAQEVALRRSEGHHYHHFIHELPTFDAVPVVHGRWEKVQVWKDNPQTTLRCSLCKTNQPIYEHEEWKFCPFCGQPMDGGAEC